MIHLLLLAINSMFLLSGSTGIHKKPRQRAKLKCGGPEVSRAATALKGRQRTGKKLSGILNLADITAASLDRYFLERQCHIDALRTADHLHDEVEDKADQKYTGDDGDLSRVVASRCWIEEQRPEVKLRRDEP